MVLLWGLAGIAVLGVVGMGVWVYVVQNVEQPSYALVRADGAIEVRDYPPLVVAEVTRGGDRKTAVSAGFRPLAGYIFAKNRAGETVAMTAPVTQTPGAGTGTAGVAADRSIAMTAPVTQEPSATGDGTWVVRFIMPSKYRLADLPAPGGGDVRLSELPARRVAAIRFSGVATDDLVAEQEARLRTWIAASGLQVTGPATYAYYNDPFTPGFLRRNEVMVEVGG